MWVLCKITNVGEVSKIPTEKGEEISKIELQLTGCGDNFIVAAFDKAALEIAANKPVVGAYYWTDLTFSVSGKEKKFQNVRLNRLTAF